MPYFEQWEGFKGRDWRISVDVRSFIQNKNTEYDEDDSILADQT